MDIENKHVKACITMHWSTETQGVNKDLHMDKSI